MDATQPSGDITGAGVSGGVSTGAEAMVRTLVASGVDTCFANPGTSEMHFVSAIDRIAGLRPVLALHECVATGAADGFGRMAGRPAATLLHAGPGLLNGASNLHNARRARTPLVNIVGDHATFHRDLDSPLTTDLEAIAATCSDRVHVAPSAAGLPHETARAVAAAGRGPGTGRVVSLLLPADHAWTSGAAAAPAEPAEPLHGVDADAVRAASAGLRRHGNRAALVLGASALTPEAVGQAKLIAARTGARVLSTNLVPRLRRGRGIAAPETIPYAVDAALAFLAGFRALVLVTATEPVAFFANPGKPGRLAPGDCEQTVLAKADADALAALEALAQEVGPAPLPALPDPPRPAVATGPVTADALARSLAALMPEDAVVVDESVSVGGPIWSSMAAARPHDVLKNMGGSIGFGLPAAAGAALAAPGRKTVCLEADGSGLYTAQALWTWAREGLDILGVIFANRKYAILRGEMRNVQAATPGPRASAILDLVNPEIDWTGLARSLGIDAVRVDTMEAFNRAFRDGSAQGRGPMLIEVMV